MAIPKRDVENTLSTQEIGYIKTVESYIDTQLQEEYGHIYHIVIDMQDMQSAADAPKPLSNRVVNKIMELYRGVGWEVKRVSDQREGNSWLEFQ